MLQRKAHSEVVSVPGVAVPRLVQQKVKMRSR